MSTFNLHPIKNSRQRCLDDQTQLLVLPRVGGIYLSLSMYLQLFSDNSNNKCFATLLKTSYKGVCKEGGTNNDSFL